MQVSNRGLAFVAREEAVVTVAFMDRTNHAIGFSHHGAEVVDGLTWTVDQSVAQMQKDCKTCSTVLGRVVTQPLPQTCWDALISLAYNLGSGTVSRSPMVAAINAGNLVAAADLFIIPALENPGRRARERTLFLTGNYTDNVNGTPFGQMLLYRSDPHAVPKPTPEVVLFPLPLETSP